MERIGSQRILQSILYRRGKKKPIETTGELNAIIRGAIPMKVQVTGGHPSKRTYQAIRIELNHELDVLRDTLDTMIDLLNDGGRICIITFHSLEDRIVKIQLQKRTKIRVHARAISRSVYVERNPKDVW